MATDLKLSDRELRCLAAIYDRAHGEMGYGVYFRSIVTDTGLDQHQVRRSVRACARKGVTELVRGLFDDEGRVAGSGYGLTPKGIAFIRNTPDRAAILRASEQERGG